MVVLLLAMCGARAAEAANPRTAVSGGAPGAAAQQQPSADVIVVGAGIAGLAAAQNLSRAGLRVVVLEARNRTGGRLYSVPTAAGHRVDLGAMWIHSARLGNPLLDLAAARGLNVSRKQNYDSGAVFVPGRRGNRASLLSYIGVARRWAALDRNITRIRAAAAAAPPGAVPDAPLMAQFEEWARHARFDAQQMRQARLLMHTRWQTLLNANASALSTLRYGDAKKIPNDDVMLADGMDAFTDGFAAGLDIRLGTVVTGISQGAAGVTVATASGVNFTAPHAIVTLPLGVLKEGAAALFRPPLPAAKLAAIDQMGMGVLDKLVLVYDAPWWPQNADFLSRELVDLSGRWCVFLNYYALFKTPILVALTPADTAHALEAATDEQVVASALEALQDMVSAGREAPAPVQTIVTRWGSDPWSRGSYSYYAVGNRLDIVDDLAQPIGRVLFAGEHTSRRPATAHGAYESGLREAARLLAIHAPAAGAGGGGGGSAAPTTSSGWPEVAAPTSAAPPAAGAPAATGPLPAEAPAEGAAAPPPASG